MSSSRHRRSRSLAVSITADKLKRWPADQLLEPQTPGPLEVVVRVCAEGDHRLGAGDAGDLGYSFGNYLREALEVGDADHHDEVVRAGHGVDLGDALNAEHRLGRLLHPLALRS